jgi:enoyl reductase-like protein
MTYYEVLNRMIELMFIPSLAQWIHSSFADRLVKILRRTKQRFATSVEISDEERIYTHPTKVVEEFVASFPRIKTQLMAAEDVDYFLYLAREGGKPVNFIPVIDKGIQKNYKKIWGVKSPNLFNLWGYAT